MSALPKVKAFKSTNFTLQSILPLVLALAALVGFPEEVAREAVTFIEASVVALVGFWGVIREFFKGGVSVRYTSNVLTYVVAFVSGLVPWLESYDIEGVIGQLITALGSGDFSLIFAAVFAVGNILYRIIQDRKEVAPAKS